MITIAMYGTYFEIRDFGSSEPSRTAAIGGMRVARRAGMSPAAIVTPTPTISETMMVLGAKTSPSLGRSALSALKSAFRPAASPRPRKRPMREATRPMTKASVITDQRICLREPPIVRIVANSRIRWATVMEKMLKMTNAPTKRATTANESRK